MTVTLDLPDGVLRRLAAEADRRGVGIDEVITELATHLPPSESARRPKRRLAFVGVGESASGISHRIDETLADGFGRD
jgi:hypothetical protein